MKKIVYNLESQDYSKNAIKNWRKRGFVYVDGSWNSFSSFKDLLYVEILIVRLGGFVNEDVINNSFF